MAYALGAYHRHEIVTNTLNSIGIIEEQWLQKNQIAGAVNNEQEFEKAVEIAKAAEGPLNFSCTILLIGKMGVGKSATLNSLFNQEMVYTDAFLLGTEEIQVVEGNIRGMNVRIIDTPGLSSASDWQWNEKILHWVKRFINKSPPDAVLYVDRFDLWNKGSEDVPLFRAITKIMGPTFWFNLSVVLTHAESDPPDAPNGFPFIYEEFLAQQCDAIQQAIHQASGNSQVLNSFGLLENGNNEYSFNSDPFRLRYYRWPSKTWVLLLSFAPKILAEAMSLLKSQDGDQPSCSHERGLQVFLPSLLNSRPQLILPEQSSENAEDDLEEASDSGDELVYDDLPPFKRLTNDQVAKLSKELKMAYYRELVYWKELFLEKQLKEEKRQRKVLKKMAGGVKNLPTESNGTTDSKEKNSHPAQLLGQMCNLVLPTFFDSENPTHQHQSLCKLLGEMVGWAKDQSLPSESNGNKSSGENNSHPTLFLCQMPDLVPPTSFDSDNPTHRYRSLCSNSRWLIRPVLNPKIWDHDVGFDGGVDIKSLFLVKDEIPVSVSGQLTKDKNECTVQMDLSTSVSSVKHSERITTSTGLDVQTVDDCKCMMYTLRAESNLNNFRWHSATAGLSTTLLGNTILSGMKLENKLIVHKRFRLLMGNAAVTDGRRVASGGCLVATLGEKDNPIRRAWATLAFSASELSRDTTFGCNLDSQFPLGRQTNVIGRANLNSHGYGQVGIGLNSSGPLGIAFLALVLIFRNVKSINTQL
ncbi:hypothetical protein J5N97_016271 [Dioscorea zingiberensis]|uniref:AIG1-type G domain-containing protein n=1 Tax=Dioscorea zingiberensis TaxID=325984 RepID=A0A9D5CJA6_9LILI|nr:hypothetical protein J5N97_016271 [Dioscorea zingiberensis]